MMNWTEAVPVVPVAVTNELMGIPIPMVLALIALFSAVLTAVVGALVKKFRTPADDREDKVVVLDASDRLIQRFQDLLKNSDEKHAADIAALGLEVSALREELAQVKTERIGLMAAIRELVRLVRRHAGAEAEHELQTIVQPTGIVLY